MTAADDEKYGKAGRTDSSVDVEGAVPGSKALLEDEYNYEGLTEREIELREKERRLNADLDARIAANPNAFPRAIYYILPNEFGERFTYYGINAFLNIYLKFLGATPEAAKSMVHTWKMVTYFCPLLGAAVSDSYLGKYKTIVILSFVYLLGLVMMLVTSIPALRSIPSVLVGLYLIALGTGGIKPCVAPHGGDQFLKSQADAMRRFFSMFYISINCGSVLSALTPLIKDNFGCWGDSIQGESDGKAIMQPVCYFGGFIGPLVLFTVALAVFIYGERYYRVVPPVGEFVPKKMLQVIIDGVMGKIRHRGQGTVVGFASARYGEAFAIETMEFVRVLGVLMPMSFVWMVYDQQSTEWQNQYEKMDQYFGVRLSPETFVTLVNPVLVVILLFSLAKWIYPLVERMGVAVTPLRRMALGGVLVSVGFLMSGFLQYEVHRRFEAAGAIVSDKGVVIAETCRGKCLHGAAQLPQWFLLTLGECLFSPTGNEFAYTQVGKSMKAFVSSFWLLTVCFGNLLVVVIERGLEHTVVDPQTGETVMEPLPWVAGANLPNKFFLYTGICFGVNLVFILIAHLYKYKPGTKNMAKRG